MPRDFDNEELDDFENMDEDDRDARYYEHAMGGPEDEDIERWYERQETREDHNQYEYDEEYYEAPLGEEAEARQHFAELKRKYHAESFKNSSPLNPLYTLLLKLESNQDLSSTDILLLRRNGLRETIRGYAQRAAQACEARYAASRNGWEAVLASRFWRMAERPEKALDVTAELAQTDKVNPKLKAAVLTTRGGAFLDLKKLDDAEKCGQQAIQLNQKKPHPYLLLGALYYQKGDPKKGDEYFAIAQQFDKNPETQEGYIKKAVSEAGKEESREVARYLVAKNPVKYDWAKKYLQ